MKRWMVVIIVVALICSLAGCRAEERWISEESGIDPQWKAKWLNATHREPFFDLLIEHPIEGLTEFPFGEMIQYKRKTVNEKSIVSLRYIVYYFEKFAGMSREDVLQCWEYYDYREMVLQGEAKDFSAFTVVDLSYLSTDGHTPEKILSQKIYSGKALMEGNALLPDWKSVADRWQLFDGEEVPFRPTRTQGIESGRSTLPEDREAVVQQRSGITMMLFNSVEEMAAYDEGVLRFWQELLKDSEDARASETATAEAFFEEKALLLIHQVSTGSADYKSVRSLRKNGDQLVLWLADVESHAGLNGDCAMRYYYYPMEIRKTDLKGIENISFRIYQEVCTVS